jgi:hypothetical protein
MLIKCKNSQKYILETCFGRKQVSVKITNKAEFDKCKYYKKYYNQQKQEINFKQNNTRTVVVTVIFSSSFLSRLAFRYQYICLHKLHSFRVALLNASNTDPVIFPSCESFPKIQHMSARRLQDNQ